MISIPCTCNLGPGRQSAYRSGFECELQFAKRLVSARVEQASLQVNEPFEVKQRSTYMGQVIAVR